MDGEVSMTECQRHGMDWLPETCETCAQLSRDYHADETRSNTGRGQGELTWTLAILGLAAGLIGSELALTLLLPWPTWMKVTFPDSGLSWAGIVSATIVSAAFILFFFIYLYWDEIKDWLNKPGPSAMAI